MKTSLLILFLLLTGMTMQAQEKFTGAIEYEIKDFLDEKDEFSPQKVTIIRGGDKIMMKMSFANKTMEQWLLVNTQNDSLYQINPGTKVYMQRSIHEKNEMLPELVRTDSVKDILGYKCHAYRIKGPKEFLGYSWVAESLGGVSKEYPSSMNMKMLGGKYVMMGADVYEEGKPVSSMTALSVNKMSAVPDSVFDISGFKKMELPYGEDEYIMVDSTTSYSIDTLAVKPPVKKLPKKKTPVKKVPVKTKAAAIKPKH